METQCPKCFEENAYHNGVCYECPDCGHTWGGDGEDDEYDDDEW